MVLTNADHVGAQETLQRQGNKNLKGEGAAKRDQTEDSDDGRGGVDGVEGDVPLRVPMDLISIVHIERLKGVETYILPSQGENGSPLSRENAHISRALVAREVMLPR